MTDLSRRARIAGAIYFSLSFVAPFRLVYLPNVLLSSSDPAKIAANIAAHETMFRIGIATDLLAGTVTLFVTLALYRLFEDVNRDLARLMVILGGLMVTPIYFANTVNDAAALLLVHRPELTSAFGTAERNGLIALFVHLHHAGVVANELFWGLWLLPFGLLVIRSRFVPAFLGYWLIVNGLSYVAICFTGVLRPEFESRLFNLLTPFIMGEVAIMLWLLVMGARPRAEKPATG